MLVKFNFRQVFIAACAIFCALIFVFSIADVESFSAQSKLLLVAAFPVHYILIYSLLPFLERVLVSPGKMFILFFSFYYLCGFLPISTYRDYVDVVGWFSIFALAFASYFLGNAIPLVFKNSVGRREAYCPPLGFLSFLYILSISSALFIYARHGVLFLNPEARFGVSAVLSYFSEMAIVLGVMSFSAIDFRGKSVVFRKLIIFLISFFCVASLGYRNQPVILVLCLFLYEIYSYGASSGFRLKPRSKLIIPLIASVGIVVFSWSFISRNDLSVGRTLNWKDTVEEFEISMPNAVMPILPFHNAAREGLGVSEVALDRIEQIEYSLGGFPLFFYDFLSLLPGKSDTGGKVLGSTVNLREDSSLTPSLLGGLYLTFGLLGPSVFLFLLGIILKRLSSGIAMNIRQYHVYGAIAIPYLFELTNRGLAKPLYIFVLAVVVMVGFFSFEKTSVQK